MPTRNSHARREGALEQGTNVDKHILHMPAATKELTDKRAQLAPDTYKAWREFGKQVFADGALDAKTKQIIAVAVAHVTQCPYCIQGHSKQAKRAGATPEELMEAIWVASEMRAGGAYAHAIVALDAIDAVAEAAD